MNQNQNVEDEKPRRSHRNVIVGALAAACFLPAVIIGAVNAPRITPTVMVRSLLPAKPFQPPRTKMIPEEQAPGAAFPAPGSAFPAPAVEMVAPEPKTITIPMVYIMGDLPKREEINTEEPANVGFLHESANGGTVRVTGFEPNH